MLDDDSLSAPKRRFSCETSVQPLLDGKVFFKPVCKNFSHLTLMGENRGLQSFDFLVQAFSAVSHDISSGHIVLGPPCGPPQPCRISEQHFSELSEKLLVWQSVDIDFIVMQTM